MQYHELGDVAQRMKPTQAVIARSEGGGSSPPLELWSVTFSGQIEADYIGGKARNMHKSKLAAKIIGTGGAEAGKYTIAAERRNLARTKPP